MGALAFIALGLMLLLILPTITYFYAKHLGRNAKAWFSIGVLLPGFATILLFRLPDIYEDLKKENNSKTIS
ncbi:MAG: hypothetical protein JNJ40_05480 [Bacteroidia bacterium]|nr:hypothetical protein [Bacteroidia bacterium]